MTERFPWTTKWIRVMTDMWPRATTGKIARQISALSGRKLSRSAICNKAVRVGLPSKKKKAVT